MAFTTERCFVTGFSENTAPFTPLLNKCKVAPAERLYYCW